MCPCKDNSALKFTANLSTPSVSLVTPGALMPGLRADLLPIHIHNQYEKVTLDRKSAPSSSFPTPSMPAKEKKAKSLR